MSGSWGLKTIRHFDRLVQYSIGMFTLYIQALISTNAKFYITLKVSRSLYSSQGVTCCVCHFEVYKRLLTGVTHYTILHQGIYQNGVESKLWEITGNEK